MERGRHPRSTRDQWRIVARRDLWGRAVGALDLLLDRIQPRGAIPEPAADRRLAIVVCYRDRPEHLSRFVPHLHRHLEGLDHEIHVIEQAETKPFNRGLLKNIGFELLRERFEFFCFHDVDLLAEAADYQPLAFPVHLAAYVEQFGYRVPYREAFGGVVLFDRETFARINGYSNGYWGWGKEDDDLLHRCRLQAIPLYRRPGRFTSLHHPREEPASEQAGQNHERLQRLIRGELDPRRDGLSTLDFRLIDTQQRDGYFQTLVEV